MLLFGISKGGFGGGLGVVAVPLMSLVISPVQAAAVLLPILCVMDVVSVWSYRGRWQWPEVRVLLPASLAGIALGTAAFGYLEESLVKLIVGVVAIAFTLYFTAFRGDRASASFAGRGFGTAAGAAAGFTSFIAHAGGPPVNMYLLRRPLDRTQFVATTVLTFAAINYAKLLPYAWLGQLDRGNLATSLMLAPLAPVGVLLGVWLHRRVSDALFFRVVYALLFVVGLKLVHDGLRG